MPTEDKYSKYTDGISAPIQGGFDVTPGTEIPYVTRAIMVAAAGDVAVTFKNGEEVTLPALQPGVVYPFRVAAVNATGTTATGIVGLY